MTELETKLEELAKELDQMAVPSATDSGRDRAVKALAGSTANRLRNILGAVASGTPTNLNGGWRRRGRPPVTEEIPEAVEDVPAITEPEAAEE